MTPPPKFKVLHRERAAGVHSSLITFLDWWETHAPFSITVAPDGGVRRDQLKQQQMFARGATKARTLGETPHGRGGALDLVPIQPNGSIDWRDKQSFLALGLIAEQHGLVWGGRWKTVDEDHVEVASWRSLPYPPALPSA